jgi:hypothetical protein
MKQLATIAFIAFLFLIGNVNAKGTEVKTLLKESVETTLELEDWMTDESVWNRDQEITAFLVNEAEPEMKIESWMINDKNWDINKTNIQVQDKDEELAFEDWMKNEKIWNR